MLSKGGQDKVHVDDKYRLEKDFEGGIQMESNLEGFQLITGVAGHKEKKRSPLTINHFCCVDLIIQSVTHLWSFRTEASRFSRLGAIFPTSPVLPHPRRSTAR